MTTQPSVDRIGQRFGPYEITKFLGRGGFADVFLGRNVNLAQQQVAIKVLDKVMIKFEKELQFHNEAAIILSLQHPSIIRFYSYDIYFAPHLTATAYPYIVMEYAAKGSLRNIHPKGTRLPLETIVTYVQQIASALQYAHGSQVIHLDVKPENILINNEGKLLLSDFGLATLLTDKRPEDIQGTPNYMPPEQLAGHPDKASDQYALAAMIYEWICGSVLFTARSIEEFIEKILSEQPASLLTRIPDLPPAVDTVVMKALSKKVQDRYPSVLKFSEAFTRAVTHPEQIAGVTPRPSSASANKPARTSQAQAQPARQVSAPPPEPLSLLPQSRATAPAPAPVATSSNQSGAVPQQQVPGEASISNKALSTPLQPTPINPGSQASVAPSFMAGMPPSMQAPAIDPGSQAAGASPFFGGTPPDAQSAIKPDPQAQQEATPFLAGTPPDAKAPDNNAGSPPQTPFNNGTVPPASSQQTPFINGATPPGPQPQAPWFSGQAAGPSSIPTQTPFLDGKPPRNVAGAIPGQPGHPGTYSPAQVKSPFLGASSSADLSPGEVKFGSPTAQPDFNQSQTIGNFGFMNHPGPPSLPPYLGRPGSGVDLGEPDPHSFQETFSQAMHYIFKPRRRRRRTALPFFVAIVASIIGSVFIGLWLGALMPSPGNELAWWGIILALIFSIGALWLFDYSGNRLLKVVFGVILAFTWSVVGFAIATIIGAGTKIGFLPDANITSILFLIGILVLCLWLTFRRA